MSKITKSAKGEKCQIRIHGVCNHDPATVVFCHEPRGSGLATKYPDTEGAYGCSKCHDVIDGRVPAPPLKSFNDIKLAFYEGARRTRILLIKKELIKL